MQEDMEGVKEIMRPNHEGLHGQIKFKHYPEDSWEP
jgi:hypothetical protein